MTVQQYVKKIKAICTPENFNHTNLDNLVMKISLDNKFHFNLSDLELTNNQKEVNDEIILNPEVINQVAECLGLLFVSEKETEGNVCFLNSNELRPEFRQNFTGIDLLDYCYAVLHLAVNEFSEINSVSIPMTSDCSIFWKLVKHGSELRKEDSLN